MEKKKKKRHPVICDNTDEPEGNYAKRKEEDKYCMVSLMYRILKKKKKKDPTHWSKVEKWLPEDEAGVHRQKLVKGFKISVRRVVNSEELLYNMVTIVDDTSLHNWDFF